MLTIREKEVVRLVSLGCTTGQVAAILRISSSTADNHRTRAMAKLGTDKAALVTRLAIKQRITNLNDRLTATERRRAGRRRAGRKHDG
jgi:DNA-binding CsgD family transcriptional regulator